VKNRRNYYRILQVQPDAPIEIIRASFRTQMLELKMHPDLGGEGSEASVLNEAYWVLSDPERRAAYDQKLFLKLAQKGQSRVKAIQSIVPVICPFCKKALGRSPAPGDVCSMCRTPLQSAPAEDGHVSGKRSLFRTSISEPIRYFTNWPGEAKKGTMVDLSPQGMRFVCEEKLSPKTVLKISCDLLEASGRITNIQENAGGARKTYAIGVFFLAVNFAEPKGVFLSTSG
jgi:hypothetical protein